MRLLKMGMVQWTRTAGHGSFWGRKFERTQILVLLILGALLPKLAASYG